MHTEDAVSPVVAFMLLLMVVVSFLSLLNAYYIPSLKEQAEVEHLASVEVVFSGIGRDIDRLVSYREDGVIHALVPLGGGDVLFSPVRSSGSLRLSGGRDLVAVTIFQESGDPFLFTTSIWNLSYHPVGNFWVNQGYLWEMGVVNVTKGSRSVWLSYTAGEDAEAARNQFVRVLAAPRIRELSSSADGQVPRHLQVSLSTMAVSPSDSFVSGNGGAGVDLLMQRSLKEMQNVTGIRVDLNSGTLEAEREQIVSGLVTLNTTRFGVSSPDSDTWTLDFSGHPVTVSLELQVLEGRVG